MKTIFLLLMFYLMFSVISFGQTKNDVLTMNDGKVYHGKLDSVTQYIVYFSEEQNTILETYYELHGFNKSLINNIQLSNGGTLSYGNTMEREYDYTEKSDRNIKVETGYDSAISFYYILAGIGILVSMIFLFTI